MRLPWRMHLFWVSLARKHPLGRLRVLHLLQPFAHCMQWRIVVP